MNYTYRAFKGEPECRICKLPIPDWIISTTHPLFGTLDHKVPKSRGGRDGRNLQPAHYLCNQFKSDKLTLTNREIKALRSDILDQFAKQRSSIPKTLRWTKLQTMVENRMRAISKATPIR